MNITLYLNKHFVTNGTRYIKYFFDIPSVGCFGSLYNTKTNTFEDQKHYYNNGECFDYKWIKKSRFYPIYGLEIDTENFTAYIKDKDDEFYENLSVFKDKFIPAFNKFYNGMQNNGIINTHIIRSFLYAFCKTIEDYKNLNQKKEDFAIVDFTNINESETEKEIIKHFSFSKDDLVIGNQVFRLKDGKIYWKINDTITETKETPVYIKTRNIIKQVKLLNADGFSNLVKGNFYDFTENMKNNNYIIINGINVNKNRVKFINVYSEPPVSNANALKQINPVS